MNTSYFCNYIEKKSRRGVHMAPEWDMGHGTLYTIDKVQFCNKKGTIPGKDKKSSRPLRLR